eukprot:22149-Pelagococcus_subviridis.AAC.2
MDRSAVRPVYARARAVNINFEMRIQRMRATTVQYSTVQCARARLHWMSFTRLAAISALRFSHMRGDGLKYFNIPSHGTGFIPAR